MKKLLSILALQLVLLFTTYAQGREDVIVNNVTTCDAGVDVWAACPNGSHYSTNISYVVAAGTSRTIYSASTGWADGKAWFPVLQA